MARFEFGGKAYDIPKFKFRELAAAAPFIDRVTARGRELKKLAASAETPEALAALVTEGGHALETMLESMHDLARVAAIGVIHALKEYPFSPATIEAQAQLIEAEMGADEFGKLNTLFEQIMGEAGMMRPGPQTPPAAAAPASTDSDSAPASSA